MSTNEDIPSFVGRDDYELDDMIIAVQEHAQKAVGFWGNSRLENFSVALNCNSQECEIERVNASITLSPHFNFWAWGNEAELFPRLEYIFRPSNNQVRAVRQPSIPRRSDYIPWKNVPISLDEAILIASELEDPPYHLFIIWGSRWVIHVNSNEGTNVYYVDYYSGTVSREEQ